MKKIEKKEKLPTIQEFIGRARKVNRVGSNTVFGRNSDGDSVTLARVPGFYGNNDTHLDPRYYDENEIWKFQEDLTQYIVDAIKEKMDRENNLKIGN